MGVVGPIPPPLLALTRTEIQLNGEILECCFVFLTEKSGVVGGDARDDLASFWLRKTKRPVLAVLLVQKAGGQPKLYRGTNMEVTQYIYVYICLLLLCIAKLAYPIYVSGAEISRNFRVYLECFEPTPAGIIEMVLRISRRF